MDDETPHPDATRAGINLSAEALLEASKAAAQMIDVWKRSDLKSMGITAPGVARHAIKGWEDGREGDHLALVAGFLKTAFEPKE